MKKWFCFGGLVLASCTAAPMPLTPTFPASSPSPTVSALSSPTSLVATVTIAPPTTTRLAPTPTNTVTPTVVASPTPHPAARVVYAYLEARAQTDMQLATSLVCSAWQGKAATEVTSFASMNTELKDAVCKVQSDGSAKVTVNCTGKILATYGAETRELDLSSFVYNVVEENGTWKMCGYE